MIDIIIILLFFFWLHAASLVARNIFRHKVLAIYSIPHCMHINIAAGSTESLYQCLSTNTSHVLKTEGIGCLYNGHIELGVVCLHKINDKTHPYMIHQYNNACMHIQHFT